MPSPWEAADADVDADAKPTHDDPTDVKPETPRKESKTSAEGKPSWAIGRGVDEDMKGDPSAGFKNNVRFWMPKGNDRRIIFLTAGEDANVTWEHNLYINGSWRNWATCLQVIGQACPLCEFADEVGKFRRYKAAFFTIIDTSSYKDRDGKEHKNTKRLLVAKKDVTEILQRRWQALQASGNDLKYAMFQVYRKEGDKSPSSGDDFTFERMIDPAKIHDKEELDYHDILAPDPDLVKMYVRRLRAERSGGGGDYGGKSSGGKSSGSKPSDEIEY